MLEEAEDRTVPLLERLKFISIFAGNLDEFFMVRVGSLFDLSLIKPDNIDNKTGMTPDEQLRAIYREIPDLIALKQKIYCEVKRELAREGIRDLTYKELTAEEKKTVDHYYKEMISPLLSPQVIGSHHPVPNLKNKALYITTLLSRAGGRYHLGLCPVPETLPSFILLPDSGGRFIRMEEVLLAKADRLFGNYRVKESLVLSVTRNADIRFDDEKFEDEEDLDFRSKVSDLLRKRRTLSIVRLELSQKPSEDFFAVIHKMVQAENHQVYYDGSPLNMKFVFDLIPKLHGELGRELSYSPYTPVNPAGLQKGGSMIRQIREKDRLLYFPYESIDPFLDLLNEAAEREDVVSIRITIYRLASTSKIARILCRAAENGKEVLAVMELRARFDEANNITWSKIMEDSGCRVIYGDKKYKCHSKICLITLRDGNRVRYITQIATGNYNEKTAAQYTDLSMMTASREIGMDGNRFFQNMLVNDEQQEGYRKLLVSPGGIKKGVMELIDEQIKLGREGFICIKANAVTERDMIDKLKEASQAGVDIQLIIRGICCIRPGVSGKTENIRVSSIVGRYLEHARIYCFGRGEKAKLYIASADMMTRNLVRRIEIACPVEDPDIRRELQWILKMQLKDRAKASLLRSDGCYERKFIFPADPEEDEQMLRRFGRVQLPENGEGCAEKSGGMSKLDAQKYFMKNHFTSGPEKENIPERKPGLLERIRGMFSGS